MLPHVGQESKDFTGCCHYVGDFAIVSFAEYGEVPQPVVIVLSGPIFIAFGKSAFIPQERVGGLQFPPLGDVFIELLFEVWSNVSFNPF